MVVVIWPVLLLLARFGRVCGQNISHSCDGNLKMFCFGQLLVWQQIWKVVVKEKFLIASCIEIKIVKEIIKTISYEIYIEGSQKLGMFYKMKSSNVWD